MLDDVFNELYSRTSRGEWATMDELREIIEKRRLPKEAETAVFTFLKDYFLELDESGNKVKLGSWAYNLFRNLGVKSL